MHDVVGRREIARLTPHERITCRAIDGARVLAGTDGGEVTANGFRGGG